ncbi:MAG: methylated-DNA--[protein]-cysteine S-methyltransferase [Oscillospiraceae bacterium]
MKTYTFYTSPIGRLLLAEENGALTHILLHTETFEGTRGETPLLGQARQQLEEYFAASRRAFSLPLGPAGTPFQTRVWRALQAIPYGQTRSYGQIAAATGNPKASRAVGMANNRNPLLIVVPCHRVIGANGALVGYGGGLPVKEYLLQLEGGRA